MKLKKVNVFLGLGFSAVLLGAITLDMKANDPEKATNILKENGFTSIELGDSTWMCGKGYLIKKNFTAINHKGEAIEGKICADNWFWLFDDKITTSPKKPKM